MKNSALISLILNLIVLALLAIGQIANYLTMWGDAQTISTQKETIEAQKEHIRILEGR